MYSEEEAVGASTQYFNGNKLAAEVFVNKYALRDNNNNLLEKTPDEMHRRIAKEFARIEKLKFKNPLSEEQIFNYLDKFAQIIPQGSPMFGIGNPYQYISLSNCYVVESPLDSYSSIHKTDEQLTQISKRRGGVGLDISNLRPANSPTTNSSRVSTGIIPFMERYSNSIREVGQNGRRGALMITISVHHPEVLEFAKVKNDLKKVTGANISIKITDEFLNAVKNNKDYEQRWPVEGTPKISKMVSAKKIWEEIVKSAHTMAEPGILLWDNIIKESPADCYADVNPSYKTVCTNPCCFSQTLTIEVVTSNGIKEIQSITNKDLIWVKDIGTWEKTSGYFYVGEFPVYDVKFANGKLLRITNNHKLSKDGNLFELKDLSIGDTICTDDQSGSTQIVSIEYRGVEPVGCIEVENSHKFTANGIISGNSELPLCEYDSCRLMLVNLFSCVENPYTKEAVFNFDKLTNLTKVCQRLMDDMVDIEIEHIDKILNKIKNDPEPDSIKSNEFALWTNIREKCEKGRRTGTGITAIGDVIAALGLKYTSVESLDMVDKIFKTIKLSAYESSVDMAEELGAFPVWNSELEKNNPFLLRIKDENPKLYKRMQKFGRRNIALLTVAPTGSVSLLAKLINRHGTSSGIEPVFQAEYTRRRKINPGDNSRVDFVDQNGDKWTEYEVYHSGLQEWMDLNPDLSKELSPYRGSCAEELNWASRVKLQGIAQRHIDHSISSTLNLPENVSVEQVMEIYNKAWEEGLKGVTVYRKNCRTGVLVDKNTKSVKINKTNAPKRPKTLPCDIHHINVSGKKYMVFVGMLDNEPYEIMAYEGVYEGAKKGNITKVSRGLYKADLGTCVIDSITERCSPEEEAITRLVSTSLRHGADIGFVVHQLEKTGGSMVTFAKCLARTLKKYIKDGTTISGEECPNCANSLVRQEGCMKCVNCEYSKCG